MSIFDELDKILYNVKSVVESKDTEPEEEDYETAESGKLAAMKQIIDRILKSDDSKKSDDKKSDKSGKSEMREDDNPLEDIKKGKKSDGVDKTFKSSKIEGMDDLDKIDGDLDDDSDDKSSLEDDDFEFDDFDYDDKPKSGGGDSEDGDDTPREGGGMKESDDEYEDGDFDDSELGDEDDFDFGDDSYESGDDSGTESGVDDYDLEGGDKVSSSGGSSSGKKDSRRDSMKDTSSKGDDSEDDIDYDDTLDYDSKDYDSLESEIEDALNRTKEGSTSKSEREMLDKMSEKMGDDSEGKSSEELADELNKEINKAIEDSDSKDGSGELAGETLDKTPDDKSFEEDMKKAGFDDKEIEKMKKEKDSDLSSEIDDEKIAKEAMEEMDKRAEKNGDKSGSALSRTIMRNVLKGKITNMEWKEMVGVFLKSKSKIKGTIGKSKTTGWGDKKHLWRDAVLPKSSTSGGGVDEIDCFVDFSGSVSQPLVFSFLQRVLELCSKLEFDSVNVYGFGVSLSKPYVIKKRDLVKGSDEKKQKFLEDMWSFISDQYLGGSIENFEEVAKQILKIKRKNHDAPILIFGDGLWALSYPNPKPPKYLKELCSRYLKDILVLIYYDVKHMDGVIRPEVGYLRDIVGLKHVITTKIDELE